MMSKPLMIGDLAAATGTKVTTIRFYEESGLMPKAVRTKSGRRTYGKPDILRLTFVRRSRELGFGLDQVRMLLSLADDHDRPCSEVSHLAERHLGEVDRKIADLVALREELSSLISQCRQGTVADCRILEALGPQEALATSHSAK